MQIKTEYWAEKFTFSKRFLPPATVGVMAAILLCTLQSRAQSPQQPSTPAPSFEVASIKPIGSDQGPFRLMFSPDGFNANGLTAKTLIGFAYNLKDFQISGGPGWVDSERYDIEAKMDEATIEALKKLPQEQAFEQRRQMMQSLLADRFKLKVDQSSKEMPIYALVVAKNGPKLTQSAAPASGPGGPADGPRSMMRMGLGELNATGVPISLLVDRLAREVDRKVVDKTGLAGRYDFTLHWAPERPMPGLSGGDNQGPAPPPPDASAPSIFTALQEQLGLKLESQKGPVETLVIASIEKPSEN